MSLSDEQVSFIADVIRTAWTLQEAAARWRERYPDVRAMRIGADEMRNEVPALKSRGRRVYFAMSDGMCVSVTRHAREAEMLILSDGGADDGDR